MRRSISLSLIAAAAAVSLGVAVTAERTPGAGASLAAVIRPLGISGIVDPCLCPTCTGSFRDAEQSARAFPLHHLGGASAV